MAKIQLRQKKRFNALGVKPVKKVDETAPTKDTLREKEEKEDQKEEKEETKEELKEEKKESNTAEIDPPVNPAASYKQTMVPNSVRKRLRAEKRAAKTTETAGTASPTVDTVPTATSTTDTTTAESSTPSRLGNLFNLGSQEKTVEEDTKVEIIKPQAIGEEKKEQIRSTVVETVDTIDTVSSTKNRSKDREFESLAGDKMQEFSVDAFTQESERLKAEGKLEEYKRPLTAIGGGKHQITSLLRQAQDNKEQLEASYSQNRLTQKESGAKYGF
ncbi:hypothetical protein CKK34_5152 [Yarrowia sp. E02]|nr:hypothetical protein CKK34_5152 [Yarrowia sp. E02]